jgi:hypothetical protein
VLDGLLDRVIADPATNQRATLLGLARTMLAESAEADDPADPAAADDPLDDP